MHATFPPELVVLEPGKISGSKQHRGGAKRAMCLRSEVGLSSGLNQIHTYQVPYMSVIVHKQFTFKDLLNVNLAGIVAHQTRPRLRHKIHYYVQYLCSSKIATAVVAIRWRGYDEELADDGAISGRSSDRRLDELVSFPFRDLSVPSLLNMVKRVGHF